MNKWILMLFYKIEPLKNGFSPVLPSGLLYFQGIHRNPKWKDLISVRDSWWPIQDPTIPAKCNFFVNFYSFQQLISKARSVMIDNYKMKSIKDLEIANAIKVLLSLESLKRVENKIIGFWIECIVLPFRSTISVQVVKDFNYTPPSIRSGISRA